MWAEHSDRVRPEWLDGNGHMNLAYYVLVFDRGTDAWLERAGLGAAYRNAVRRSVFAVESHTIYRHEVGLDAPLQVRTGLAGFRDKRIHLLQEMRSDGIEVAMQEVMFLHVDLATRRSIRLGDDATAALVSLMLPTALSRPAWSGRRVGEGH